MALRFKVDMHSPVPVYKQMIATIIAAIESRDLGPGDRLPSIRELSSRLKINPNTTAKVYRELELRGFVDSRAGSGCFVKQIDAKSAIAERNARMEELLEKVLDDARNLHIEEGDFLRFLKSRRGT